MDYMEPEDEWYPYWVIVMERGQESLQSWANLRRPLPDITLKPILMVNVVDSANLMLIEKEDIPCGTNGILIPCMEWSLGYPLWAKSTEVHEYW